VKGAGLHYYHPVVTWTIVHLEEEEEEDESGVSVRCFDEGQ